MCILLKLNLSLDMYGYRKLEWYLLWAYKLSIKSTSNNDNLLQLALTWPLHFLAPSLILNCKF